MPSSEELRVMFGTFDADGSGKISASELLAILTRAGGGKAMALADAEELIKAVDVNGDGELDLDEVCAPFLPGPLGSLGL